MDWLVIVAIICGIGWLPVLWRFFDSWRKRHNPISLAICLTITLLVYTCLIGIERNLNLISARWGWTAFLFFNALVEVNFYVSFWWTKKKWPYSRDNVKSSTDPRR